MSNGGDLTFIRMAMNGAARRQEAIANNIANAETPGYRREMVNFEAVLRQQLDQQQAATRGFDASQLHTTDARHLSKHTPSAGASQGPPSSGGADDNTFGSGGRNDGNNVDLGLEMTNLAITQIQFAALTTAMAARLRTLRSVIENA